MTVTETTARKSAPAAGRERWFKKDEIGPIERMPSMADVMTVAAKAWSDSFDSLSSSHGEVTFKSLSVTKVEDLVHHRSSLPIFASIRAATWQTVAGIVLDRSFLFTVIEAFFGGNAEESPRDDNRPVSPVEMRIVDVIGGQVATALTAGFKDFTTARFEFAQTQPRPEANFLGKPLTMVMVATFELKAVGRVAEIEVLLPQPVLDALGDTLSGPGRAPPIDGARWSVQLKAEVERAAMHLQAKLDLRPMSLGAIARMRPGQILELPLGSANNVMLTCNEETLFRCDLGQSVGFYTVRIDEALTPHPPSRKDG